MSRLAKEGRKYGVFLGLVTQRPAELDPTIMSQCSTLFAMRMSNDRDQALLRSAVSDSAANLFAFVPALGTREALAFGVGIAVADPADLCRIAAPIAATKRSVHRRSGQPNGRPGSQFHRRGGRALARRDHAAKGGRG